MPKSVDNTHLKFAVLATDIAMFTLRDGELLTRLIKVDRPPFFKDSKGLPGGLLRPEETAEEAAVRIVEAKTGIAEKKLYIEQLYTFSRVDRDPRGRVVAVAYMAFTPWENLSDEEKKDTHDTWWTSIKNAKKLAYDHDEVLALALKRLRTRIAYTTLLCKLMPKEFTLTELESAYETILGTELDKRNFRKKILKLAVLTEVPRKREGGRFRPAQLYRFASTKVDEIEVL